MRSFLFIILLTTISTSLFSQTDSTKIGFVSYWSIGDSYNFKVSKTKKQWEDGVLSKEEKQEYIVNFTIIDSTVNSYTIKWSYEDDLGSKYDIPEKLLENLNKYRITEIVYKTSELGNFIEIINWEEIGKNMNGMFDNILKDLEKEDISIGKKFKQAMEPFKDLSSSKQGIEQLVSKELQLFHFPMGIEFDITKPLFYDEELPNIFGGNPIKAKAKITFESVDFNKSFCVFTHGMGLDPEDTKNILEQLFKKMKIDNKKMKKALKNAIYEVNDSSKYEYYYNPGIPHKIETTREMVLNIDKEKSNMIEKLIIELIYNQ